MSRFLILIVFVLWMVWTGQGAPKYQSNLYLIGVFAGGFALIVLFMGLWSRVLARRVNGPGFYKSLNRFNHSITVARFLIPAWFGIGLFLLDWGNFVVTHLGFLERWPVVLPGTVLSTWPAFVAWMGLWWAQYPAERTLREQNMLAELDANLPVHAPPGFCRYFMVNLRLQILFTIVPVVLILFVRDLAAVVMFRGGWVETAGTATETSLPGVVDGLVQIGSVVFVFAIAPEILRRVLQTQSLPASPLRRRLEEMCRRTNLRYRDILLWRTDNAMGNAAVMGILPHMRYILLSDLLLETMSDEQIEAVFAHEVGHVAHRHMHWFVAFVMVYFVLIWGLGVVLDKAFPVFMAQSWISNLLTIPVFGMMFMMISLLSRWFERQADVYAARTMQMNEGPVVSQLSVYNDLPQLETTRIPSSPVEREPLSYVGHYGASIFGSALHRVAVINNIPVRAPNFSHGSIADRVSYLQELSGDPARTGNFDRIMGKIYLAMLAVLVFGGCTFVLYYLHFGASSGY